MYSLSSAAMSYSPEHSHQYQQEQSSKSETAHKQYFKMYQLEQQTYTTK
jgi:hypothetical protein